MTEEAIADLARLRAIAEEGRRLPLLGGRYLILWGGIVALATILHGAVVAQILPLPPIAIAVIWFGLMSGAWLITHFGLGRSAKPSASDIGNRIERTVWQIGGGFLGLIAISIFLGAFITLSQSGDVSRFALFGLMPPIMFGVYAIALRVTAEAAIQPVLKPYTLISLIFAVLTTLLTGQIWQFVASAIGICMVVIVPGWILLRIEAEAHHG
jgi:hypothetical protein